MPSEELEKHLDCVDRLSLQKKFTFAFEYINFAVDQIFFPEEYDNLKQLVKDNAMKFGIVLK